MINNIPHSLLIAVIGVLTGQRIDESVEHPMIDVDGQMKHRLNSLGQPIHHTDEGIKNFHRWFGDSKAVDEHGRPKVMYHGTGAILTKKGTEGGIREFKTKNDLPHWVTDDPKLAHGYAGSSNTSNILPVYIKSHRPYKSDVRSDDDWAFSKNDVKNRILQQSPVQDKAALNDHIKDLFSSVPYSEHRYQSLWNAAGAATRFKNMGFDSIHHFERGANTYAVMDSNQIKSAIGNAGRFKSKSNQIDESVEEHPMIDVDGVQKHRHNSLGQPIHHTDEGIKNFHHWASNDVLVDEHGRPKVFYHGTSKDTDFTGFKVPKNGAWFTDNSDHASSYAKENDSQDIKYEGGKFIHLNTASRVIPVYLKSASTYNMTHVDREAVNKQNYKKAQGIHFDGLRNKNHDMVYHGAGVYTVIGSPDQVKSAIGNVGSFKHKTKITESEDYREDHTSPDPESGAPAHNLSSNGVYPEDFYSSKGVQYYGDGRADDKIVHAHLKSLRNRPEADVKIYRAVPNKDEIKDINPGDWVTTNLEYAHDHGEARFSDHKVLTKNVKAKELFTDGNSFHEFGYHPVKQQHTMTDSVRRAYINMTND